VLQTAAPGYGVTRRTLELRWTEDGVQRTAAIEERTVVGSAPDAGIVLGDPAVSRIHAEFEVRDDGVWLRDLDSRNGTYIEGIQVSLARVPDRARIRFGSTVINAERAAKATPVDLWPYEQFGPVIGRSVVMRELFARLARVAPTDSTVLIQGETGTGKDLVARAIHEASPRADKPLVVVDCAALAEGVLEAELFGHAKGAFTGAVGARAGAIESADRGTVFLDEVGELPLSVQPKLLRVIESRTVRRLGEASYRAANVRFLTATHRDLRKMVNSGGFREDLYFRLAVLPVTVPPLRERTEDIPALLEHFAPPGAIGGEIVAEALQRAWLGNVRELRNFVERVVAFGAKDALAMSPARTDADAQGSVASYDKPLRAAREACVEDFEREYVRRLLQKHNRNVNAVAEAADVDRTYIYRLIRKHGL